ncbi:MAG: hypothetical protein GY841_17610 [FCB group bacterium]|nr:hypothetical protein [FCB group bacterium]
MRYSAAEYTGLDLFEGDMDNGEEYATIKLVKTRKEHRCHLSFYENDSNKEHNVKKGEYARFEKALYEGEWVSYYCCVECMDKWLDETYGIKKEE